jgi:hypothetical protein
MADDEPATNRVIGARKDLVTGLVVGRLNHAVRMNIKHPPAVHDEAVVPEINPVGAEQQKPPVASDPLHPGPDGGGINGLGVRSLQPGQHSTLAPVAMPGRAETAEEFSAHPDRQRQRSAGTKSYPERSRRRHRTDRVGAGRPDPDGGQIKDTQRQTTTRLELGSHSGPRAPPCMRVPARGRLPHASGDRPSPGCLPGRRVSGSRGAGLRRATASEVHAEVSKALKGPRDCPEGRRSATAGKARTRPAGRPGR